MRRAEERAGARVRIAALITFAGGVGLFLLGMKLMTDGLRVAAGDALRHVLSHWTSTPARGIAAGLLVTSVVQSSSAVIFAVIGFVNAGLLTLSQSVGVIYGAGIGTTMTSWLVAAVGLKVDLKVLALPAIAIGMFMRVVASGRRASLGEALAGFGVFLLGIDVLKSAFDAIDAGPLLAALSGEGLAQRFAFMLAGVLLTVAMQSSSAAIALTLTAVAGGAAPVAAGAALIVGANIGTASTGLLAVIGATPAAKRAAIAHLTFTMTGGAVAFALLPGLLWLAQAGVQMVSLGTAPAITLAVFHTMVAVLGLAAVLPATPWLVRRLERTFVTAEEDRARSQHLDETALAMPALALNALVLELMRIGAYARAAALDALQAATPQTARLARERQIVEGLALVAADFASRAHRNELPADLAAGFPQAIRVTQYLADLAERAEEVARNRERLEAGGGAAATGSLAAWRSAAARLIGQADPERPDYAPAACEDAMRVLQQDYQNVKDELLRNASSGQVPVAGMAAQLDELSAARRALDQALKAARYTAQVRALTLPAGGAPAVKAQESVAAESAPDTHGVSRSWPRLPIPGAPGAARGASRRARRRQNSRAMKRSEYPLQTVPHM
jgi:phosphate:Na+ symporter